MSTKYIHFVVVLKRHSFTYCKMYMTANTVLCLWLKPWLVSASSYHFLIFLSYSLYKYTCLYAHYTGKPNCSLFQYFSHYLQWRPVDMFQKLPQCGNLYKSVIQGAADIPDGF
jgi:hypothetical protein